MAARDKLPSGWDGDGNHDAGASDRPKCGSELGAVGNELGAVGNELGAVGTELGAVGKELGAIGNKLVGDRTTRWRGVGELARCVGWAQCGASVTATVGHVANKRSKRWDNCVAAAAAAAAAAANGERIAAA